MSLSLPPSWNQPILVAAAGTVAAALLPAWEQRQASSTTAVGGFLSLSSLQLLQVAAYALNVLATAQPGRFDGQMARQQQEETAALLLKDSGAGTTTMTTTNEDTQDEDEACIDPAVAAMSTGRRGRTMLAPKGWAFAIWAPIFLGELVHVGTSCLLSASSSSSTTTTTTVQLLQRTAPGFVIAQVFQSLWTASFRPKYQGWSSFISFAMLSGIALSLNGPHAAIAAARHDLAWWPYLLHGLPISMHFGWTTAASLVNLNGCLAMMDAVKTSSSSPSSSTDTTSSWLLTAVGHTSVVAATVLGVTVTLSRRAPVYGGVLCWALLACADGMTDRLRSFQQPQPESTSTVVVVPATTGTTTAAQVQQWLCFTGAGIVAVATVIATCNISSR